MNSTVSTPADAATIVAALRRVSPRFTRPQIAPRSVLIYGGVLALWIALTIGAWFARGLFAWSTGLAYVCYDTWLLLYVAHRTWYLLRLPAGAEPADHAADVAARSAGGAPIDAAAAGAPTGAAPRLGILIAAYDEAPALPTTLDALLPQLAVDDVVLIVDDGSTDETATMLAARFGVTEHGEVDPRSSALHPGLQVLRVRHGGKARALNAGLARLRTDVVVTVDADTKLAPDALAALRRAFAAVPSMVAACCVIRPVCAAGFLAGCFEWFQTYEYMRAFCSRIAWMRADALLLVSGAFAGFRRDALLAVGGFDPRCLVEDYELIHRLHRYRYEHGLDWQVRVLNGPRAITDAPGSIASFLKQRRRWFAGFLQTQYWNCDMTCNRRYGSVGRWMLPIKAIDTMQPIFGLTAFVLLLVFAATGKLRILTPVLAVIGAKILIDVGFHLWWVNIYSRWTGQRASRGGFLLAFLAAVTEPFCFQLLRHLGAAWGWYGFITRSHAWGITASVPAVDGRAE